jgi:DNA-binding response OmpR family regulator
LKEKYTILTVDDSSTNHKIIGKFISDSYDQKIALSGKECLEHVSKDLPDLILLDVTMPDMDGYETCTKLRAMDEMKHVPILFLSGRCSTEEKLKGYEVGGDDYITKPFEAEELLVKIEKSIKNKIGMESLSNQIEKTTAFANKLLNNNGSIQLCLDFFRSLFQCETMDDLTQKFFDAIRRLGLSSSMQFTIGTKEFYYSDDGVHRDMEVAILSKMVGQKPFVEIGKRWVINYEQISLLIRNPPNESAESKEAVVDYLTTLVRGLHSRLIDIVAQSKLEFQKNKLKFVIKRANESLSTSEKQFSDLISKSNAIFQQLVNSIEDQVETLHITENQESAIYGLVRTAEKDMDQLHSSLMKIEEDFFKNIQELHGKESD